MSGNEGMYNKLWRGIYLNKGSFAMTLVITIGISLYVAMTTTYANLGHAQQRFTMTTTSPIIIFCHKKITVPLEESPNKSPAYRD